MRRHRPPALAPYVCDVVADLGDLGQARLVGPVSRVPCAAEHDVPYRLPPRRVDCILRISDEWSAWSYVEAVNVCTVEKYGLDCFEGGGGDGVVGPVFIGKESSKLL